MKNNHRQYNGFSLVELSIVLVILGLLTGGILGGQALMHAAELRSVTTQVHQYQTAINLFKAKYFYLPGDMPNATSFWPTNCIDDTNNPCNGDGDGMFEDTLIARERLRAWQHLALAGLIEGTYSGIMPYASNVSVPVAKFGQNVFFLEHNNNTAYGKKGNRLELASLPSCNGVPNGGALSAEDAFSIDTKMDDGLADSGKIMAYKGHAVAACAPPLANCVTADISAANASYILSTNEKHCRIGFWLE